VEEEFRRMGKYGNFRTFRPQRYVMTTVFRSLKSTLDLFFSISVYQPCLSQLVLISTLSISAYLRYYSPLYLNLNRNGEAFLSSDVFS
jgi:hypothetical protein